MGTRDIRIAVIGTSGSGKTTLAKAFATQLDLPHIELDALNWQAGWRSLSRSDPEHFVQRVTLAVAADGWVVDANYSLVRDLIWRRATHLVWLDFGRPTVMYRITRRTLARLVLRSRMWAGNRERWRNLLRPSGPIRWAWSTWPRRRRECEERIGQSDNAHLVVLRLRRPRDVNALLGRLAKSGGPSALTGFGTAS